MFARLLSIFRKEPTPKRFRWDDCRRLFVVWGDPLRDYQEPDYDTDPRQYDLELFKDPVSDDEFEFRSRRKVKAFLDPEDAIEFAYHCNLDGVMCPVYDDVDGEWVYNEEATGRLAVRIC